MATFHRSIHGHYLFTCVRDTSGEIYTLKSPYQSNHDLVKLELALLKCTPKLNEILTNKPCVVFDGRLLPLHFITRLYSDEFTADGLKRQLRMDVVEGYLAVSQYIGAFTCQSVMVREDYRAVIVDLGRYSNTCYTAECMGVYTCSGVPSLYRNTARLACVLAEIMVDSDSVHKCNISSGDDRPLCAIDLCNEEDGFVYAMFVGQWALSANDPFGKVTNLVRSYRMNVDELTDAINVLEMRIETDGRCRRLSDLVNPPNDYVSYMTLDNCRAALYVHVNVERMNGHVCSMQCEDIIARLSKIDLRNLLDVMQYEPVVEVKFGTHPYVMLLYDIVVCIQEKMRMIWQEINGWKSEVVRLQCEKERYTRRMESLELLLDQDKRCIVFSGFDLQKECHEHRYITSYGTVPTDDLYTDVNSVVETLIAHDKDLVETRSAHMLYDTFKVYDYSTSCADVSFCNQPCLRGMHVIPSGQSLSSISDSIAGVLGFAVDAIDGKLYVMITPLPSCEIHFESIHENDEHETFIICIQDLIAGVCYLHDNGYYHGAVSSKYIRRIHAFRYALMGLQNMRYVGDGNVLQSISVSSIYQSNIPEIRYSDGDVIGYEKPGHYMCKPFKLDIYAIGLLMFSIVYGYEPPIGMNRYQRSVSGPVSETMRTCCEREMVRLISTDSPISDELTLSVDRAARFKRLIDRCLDDDPDKRPTAQELMGFI